MFCPKCGTALPEGAKFCASCGAGIASEATPQATAAAPQPVQQYAQPITPAPQPAPQYIPPAPQPTYANVVPQPAYNAMPQNTTVARFPVFPFIAAGSMILTIVMVFLPWLKSYLVNFSLIDIAKLERYFSSDDVGVLAAFLIIYLVGVALLIPSIITAFVKRHKMPIGFTIASSAIIIFDIIFFLIVVGEVNFVEPTAAPVFALIFAILNIVFNILARKVKRIY